jgi:hypothetical protein
MIEAAVLFAVFEGAQAAVKGVKAAVQLGKEVREVYKDLSTFFNAQGQIEVAYQKSQAGVPTAEEDGRTATQKALDIVFMRREMIRMEVELRETLVYGFNESGLYEEMCKERAKIIAAEQEAIRAARMHQQRLDGEARRRKEEKIEIAVGAVGAVIGIAIFLFIIWMFTQGGRW